MLGIIGLVLFILAIVILNFGLVWVKAYVSGVPVAFIELIALQLRMIPVRTIVDARITLIKSGFNVSVDDLSTHHLAGGDVIMVTAGLLKAKGHFWKPRKIKNKMTVSYILRVLNAAKRMFPEVP